jgi:hypothetical protein
VNKRLSLPQKGNSRAIHFHRGGDLFGSIDRDGTWKRMSPTPPLPAAAAVVKRSSGPAATREPTTQLPLIRVKRIIKVDKDIQKCGNEAATLITRATVHFPLPQTQTQTQTNIIGIIHYVFS